MKPPSRPSVAPVTNDASLEQIHSTASVLRAAHESAYAPESIASLSLGGLDGTTRGRFDEHSGESLMHVKTGRLDHVSALVGYVHAANRKVVAVIMNSEDAHRGPGQEFEVRWVQARP